MGKKKKIVEEVKVEIQQEEVQPIVETPKYDPIYDQMDKWCKQAERGYIQGIPYADLIKIHQYNDRKLNRTSGLDSSCGVCVLRTIKLFNSLKFK